jgi:hypothetical protein
VAGGGGGVFATHLEVMYLLAHERPHCRSKRKVARREHVPSVGRPPCCGEPRRAFVYLTRPLLLHEHGSQWVGGWVGSCESEV